MEGLPKVEYHPECDFRGIPAYFLEKLVETGFHGEDVAEAVERLVCGIVEKKLRQEGNKTEALGALYDQVTDGDITKEDFLRRVRNVFGITEVEGESIEDFFSGYGVLWDQAEIEESYIPIRLDPEPDALPLLDDKSFLKRFPSIEHVVHFLYKTRNRGLHLGSFEVMGISTIREFLNLVNEEDKRAIAVYQCVRTIFRW